MYQKISINETNRSRFSLRKASINDSAFYYEVKKKVLKNYIEEIWGWDEAFQIQFHIDNYHVDHTQIIMVNEIMAGTIEVKEDVRSIFISGLYLLPLYQNSGIGTQILRDYIEKAKENSKRVELEVLRLNLNAQRLYKKLGFILEPGDENKYFMYKECSK
jgi:RimJ/RimL family protein N-acetyltransferase